MDSEYDNLLIIPHEDVADVDCCGCLMVRVHGGEADILCNECGAVVRTVVIGDVEAAMLEMAQVDTICSACCTHCGALNTFPGVSAIEAFICSECGEGVAVDRSVQ
jgi:hypothetical protein